MSRSRRSTLLLTVATIAIPVTLSACSSTGSSINATGMRSPTGGATEPVRDATKVDAARLLRIAQATEGAGDLPNAAAMYQRAVSLDPDSTEALLALAKIYRKLGVPENAAQTFGTVIAREPDNLDARRGLGNALISLNRPKEALAEFERMIVTDPLDPRGYDGRGIALSMQGLYGEARASFETGLKLAPDDVRLNNNLAHTLVMSGKAAEAMPILKRLSSNPGAPDRVRENLALAERHLADRAEMSDLGPPAQGGAAPIVPFATNETIEPPAAATAQAIPAIPSDEPPLALAGQGAIAATAHQESVPVEVLDPERPAAETAMANAPVNAAAATAILVPTPPLAAARMVDAPIAKATPTPAQPIQSDVASVATTPPATLLRLGLLPKAGPWTEPTGGFIVTVSETPGQAMAKNVESSKPSAAVRVESDAPSDMASLPRSLLTPNPNIELSALANSPIQPGPGDETIPEASLQDVAPAAGPTANTVDAPGGGRNSETRRYRVYLAPTIYTKLAHDRAERLTRVVPELLAGLTSQIITVTGKEPVTRYTLRSPSEMSERQATALCGALISHEVPCDVSLIPVGALAQTSQVNQIAPAAGAEDPSDQPAE